MSANAPAVTTGITADGTHPQVKARHMKANAMRIIFMCATWFGIVMLGVLLWDVLSDGLKWLNWDFVNNFPSRKPAESGIKAALFGTAWLMAMTALISIPTGIAAAIYLEEFAAKNRLNRFIEVNISNLAGVPSIVYGILGLELFIRAMGFGRTLLAGAGTMSLLVLPVIILAAREAIKAVPDSVRQAAYAVGATKLQTVAAHVLPASLPGILTGIILAMSRALGETAPMIMIGALTYVAFVPNGPRDEFTTLPIQIYNWVGRPQAEFHELAAAGIIVLMAVLLTMNALAVFIRFRAEKNLKW